MSLMVEKAADSSKHLTDDEGKSIAQHIGYSMEDGSELWAYNRTDFAGNPRDLVHQIIGDGVYSIFYPNDMSYYTWDIYT